MCHPTQSLPFAELTKQHATCFNLAVALVTNLHVEKRSHRFEPRQVSTMWVLRVFTSGQTSASIVGSKRSYFSCGPDDGLGFGRKDGPINHVVLRSFNAGTECEPWSAGFCSVGT
ncbi:hypothetical protein AMECASPLE_035114 [Ameca splendens]|uniref:Uncharacterized protein n=1 Tax=Ameca splendens TaxID=208324 RepID=A0ABV0Y753_9TELE